MFDIPKLLTLAGVAERLGVPKDRAAYYLRTREVRPVARAGQAKVYAEDDIAALITRLQSEGVI